MGRFFGGVAAAVAVILLIFGIRAAVGVQIDSSHVGVVANYGHVDPNQTPLGPGYQSINPFGGVSIYSVDTRPQSFKFTEIKGAGSDGQGIYYDVNVNYQIDPTQAPTLVIKGGPDNPADHLLQNIVTPNLQSELRALSPHYSILPGAISATGQDIYIQNHRAELQTALDKALAGTVDQWGIHVLAINVPNIHADPAFEKAIEDTALKQQSLAQAKADAAAAVAKAQGEADANKAKQSGISATTLQQQQLDIESVYAQAALDAAKHWDGKLPATYAGGALPYLPIQPSPPAH